MKMERKGYQVNSCLLREYAHEPMAHVSCEVYRAVSTTNFSVDWTVRRLLRKTTENECGTSREK